MKATAVSGACLLFLFTLSAADVCTDFTTPNSALFRCNAELVRRSMSACEGSCKTSLEQYANDCLDGPSRTAFKNTIASICKGDTPSVNPACSAFSDTGSDLFRCNADLVRRSQSACGGSCRSLLEDYVSDCLQGPAAGSFGDSINNLCGEGPTGRNVNGTSTDGVETMGPTALSIASAFFFAFYATFF